MKEWSSLTDAFLDLYDETILKGIDFDRAVNLIVYDQYVNHLVSKLLTRNIYATTRMMTLDSNFRGSIFY